MNHTKGPFTISGIAGDNNIMARVGHQRKTVAIVPGWPGITPEEHKANLELFAAAPDLLAGCQKALVHYETLDGGNRVRLDREQRAEMEALREAIAKAVQS